MWTHRRRSTYEPMFVVSFHLGVVRNGRVVELEPPHLIQLVVGRGLVDLLTEPSADFPTGDVLHQLGLVVAVQPQPVQVQSIAFRHQQGLKYHRK